MGSEDHETLEEHTGSDLLEAAIFDFIKHVEQERAEPMRVGVRIAEVGDHRDQEMVLT